MILGVDRLDCFLYGLCMATTQKREARSYFAKLEANTGWLLGGVKRHQSSRFATAKQAWDWLETAISINREAGRDPKTGLDEDGIYLSDLPAEIEA